MRSELLQRAQLRNVLFQQLLIVLLRFVYGLHARRPLVGDRPRLPPDAKIFDLIFMSILSAIPAVGPSIHLRDLALALLSFVSSLGGLRRHVGRRLGFGVRLSLASGCLDALSLGARFRRLRGRDARLGLSNSSGDHTPGILRVFDEARQEEVTERRIEQCRGPDWLQASARFQA